MLIGIAWYAVFAATVVNRQYPSGREIKVESGRVPARIAQSTPSCTRYTNLVLKLVQLSLSIGRAWAAFANVRFPSTRTRVAYPRLSRGRCRRRGASTISRYSSTQRRRSVAVTKRGREKAKHRIGTQGVAAAMVKGSGHPPRAMLSLSVGPASPAKGRPRPARASS